MGRAVNRAQLGHSGLTHLAAKGRSAPELQLAHQAGQLVHPAVAAGQLVEQSPAHGVPGQAQELRRQPVQGTNLHQTIFMFQDA